MNHEHEYIKEVAKRYRCETHGEHDKTMIVRVWGSENSFNHVYCIYCYDNLLSRHLLQMSEVSGGEGE